MNQESLKGNKQEKWRDEVIVIHVLEVRFHGLRACFRAANSGAHGNKAFQSDCSFLQQTARNDCTR